MEYLQRMQIIIIVLGILLVLCLITLKFRNIKMRRKISEDKTFLESYKKHRPLKNFLICLIIWGIITVALYMYNPNTIGATIILGAIILWAKVITIRRADPILKDLLDVSFVKEEKEDNSKEKVYRCYYELPTSIKGDIVVQREKNTTRYRYLSKIPVRTSVDIDEDNPITRDRLLYEVSKVSSSYDHISREIPVKHFFMSYSKGECYINITLFDGSDNSLNRYIITSYIEYKTMALIKEVADNIDSQIEEIIKRIDI